MSKPCADVPPPELSIVATTICFPRIPEPGINGALTTAQKGTGAPDSIDSFVADVIKSGGGRSDPELVDLLVRKSTEVRSGDGCGIDGVAL